MKNYKELIILIAEDDDGHAELIKDGFIESGVMNHQMRFKNGEEIWHFLSGIGTTVRDKTKSYLLHINMPLMDGMEVLKNIKLDEELKHIPVVMLTTTDDPKEIDACYKLGCNFYITKPVKFSLFADVLNRMGLFLQIVKVIN